MSSYDGIEGNIVCVHELDISPAELDPTVLTYDHRLFHNDFRAYPISNQISFISWTSYVSVIYGAVIF